VGLAEVPSSDWFCRECDGHGAQYAASLAKSLAAAKEQVAAMAASAASAEQQRAREATAKKQPFPSHWTFCKAGDDIVGNDRHLIDVEVIHTIGVHLDAIAMSSKVTDKPR